MATIDRLLAQRLAGTLEKFLAGRLPREAVASELRKTADWLTQQGGATEEKVKEEKKADERIPRIFAVWVEATARDPRVTKLTGGRASKIAARLKDGYSEAEITHAIRNIASSPWHSGQNDQKKIYNDLTLICRNGETLEKYRDLNPASISQADHDDISAREAELKAQSLRALKEGDHDAYSAANAELRELQRSR
jgi:hypothetical protein